MFNHLEFIRNEWGDDGVDRGVGNSLGGSDYLAAGANHSLVGFNP